MQSSQMKNYITSTLPNINLVPYKVWFLNLCLPSTYFSTNCNSYRSVADNFLPNVAAVLISTSYLVKGDITMKE